MKHYVIVLRPGATTPDLGMVEMGTIVSTHTENFKAHDRVDKLNKLYNISSRQPIFGVVKSAVTLIKGGRHPELATKWLEDKFDDDATYTMKCILNPSWRGGVPITDEAVGYWLEDLKLTLDELRGRYEGRARTELDAANANTLELAERKARVRAVGRELTSSRSEITYTFPAVRGMQAGRAYFAAQIPYSALVKLFVFDDEDLVPAQHRAQRVLSEGRAEKICEYVLGNADYVLPALTASVSAEMHFEAIEVSGAANRLGLLHIPIESTMLINDGQHRRRGIELALVRRPALHDETVVVTIFFDQGLERAQQMFADINGKQVKPSSAINALYDRRNPYNAWVLSVIDLLPEIGQRIDVENSNIGTKSFKLWSLITFRKFLSLLTGVSERNVDHIDLERLTAIDEFVVKFFVQCRARIPRWTYMVDGTIPAVEVRENLVIGHAVWLEALAMFANLALFAVDGKPADPTSDGIVDPAAANWIKMFALNRVEPNKASPMWENRCVVLGKMQKTTDGVKGTAAQLLKFADVELPEAMAALELRLVA